MMVDFTIWKAREEDKYAVKIRYGKKRKNSKKVTLSMTTFSIPKHIYQFLLGLGFGEE